MGALPDREGGSFLTQRSDQRRGQFQEGSCTKRRVDRSLGAGHAMGDDRSGLRAYMMPVYAALFSIVFSGPLIGLVTYVFQIDGESLPKAVADGMAGSVM